MLEVKWNHVKGRFSHSAHLRRLAGLQKRHLKKSFQKTMLPASWQQALQGFDINGFSWQSDPISAQGVLIYDPQGRVATLIQFYRQNHMPVDMIAPRLLSSFRSRVSGDMTPWAVFDIRAAIPAEFGLQRFRFETGRYELNFQSRQTQLQMIRFGPAAVWLRRQGLAAMAKDSFLPNTKRAPRWLQCDAEAIEGQITPASRADRILRKIRRRPVYQVFRLWHEFEKNRILGVRVSGKTPIDRRQFSAICEQYETV